MRPADAARLTEIAERLEAIDVEREQLFAERVTIWRRCSDDGDKQKAIAAPSRVIEGAVTQALRKQRMANT